MPSKKAKPTFSGRKDSVNKPSTKRPQKQSLEMRHTEAGTRLLPLPKRSWFKPKTWTRNIPTPVRASLPKARYIALETWRLLVSHWKLFGGIAVIYGLLNLLLVSGLSDPTSLTDFKDILSGVFTGATGQIKTTFTSFLILLTTANRSSSQISSVYESILLLLGSLAIIWSLRQAMAKHTAQVRDSFYRGMYPLIPFVLVLVVISIQLLPATIGGYVYATVISNSIATDIIEKLLFALGSALLLLWSLRMITSSIFALYIVTLPDISPLGALQSAKELVYKRRLLIWRKLIFLPFLLLVAAALIELPLILFFTAAAYWVFFAYSTLAIIFFHGYIYVLYRKLL